MKNHVRDLWLATAIAGAITGASAFEIAAQDVQATASAWEQRLNARIGLVLRDTSSDWEITMRAEEHFPMSSTFKSLLCGAVLARVDAGQESLARRVTYSKEDLVTYSPVTEQHVDTGLTVAELCEATVTLSDNTAANLLLDTVGGPQGLTAFLREIGDLDTRLDRQETDLNSGLPGDLRDTTTPRAILRTLEGLLFGEILEPTSAGQLRQWMIDDKVADALIRAHLPAGWVIGDKTGTGGHGSRGIVAFIQPEEGQRYMAAIYLTESNADFATRNQVIADIGKAMIAEIEAR